ncbi:MAG TPA: hypothetical protein VJU61_24760 [Polyangiaceae bacterium]|nr:hypothetical protein [Polyangiaceae bacterium]
MRPFLAGLLCWLGLLCLGPRAAWADTSSGLWPELSVPVQAPSEPSQDAALVIGIDRYDALPRVVGAADNARDWEKYFLFGRRVPAERVRLLTNQDATVDSMTGRAKELSAAIPAGGTLFIVFIGHGSAGAPGKSGRLLGSDVRADEGSFAKRSLEYEDLVAATSSGAQARTVMVLDACFSGVSSDGKMLLQNVQAVVASKLIMAPGLSVFSAGQASEYAGALPGSQRPALSYLVLGALRGWADVDGDGAITATEVHQYASLVLRSLPNNHEQHPQLSSDAPDEPIERGSEKGPDLAVVRSKLSQWVPATEAADGEVDVAVGCLGKAVISPAEGFEMLDNRSLLAPTKVDTNQQGAVSSMHYRLAPGVHALTFRAPRCKAETRNVTVKRGATVRVSGVLSSAETLSERAPFGKLNHGYIGIEPVLALILVDDSEDFSNEPGTLPPAVRYSTSTTTAGLRLSFGFVSSYFEAGLSVAGMLGRSVSREVIPCENQGEVTGTCYRYAESGSKETVMSTWQLAPRATLGLRIPYEGFALRPLLLSAGIINDIEVSSWSNGSDSDTVQLSHELFVQVAAGVGADISLTCDFALRPLVQGVHDVDTSRISLELGVGIAYMPSTACARERALPAGLEVR